MRLARRLAAVKSKLRPGVQDGPTSYQETHFAEAFQAGRALPRTNLQPCSDPHHGPSLFEVTPTYSAAVRQVVLRG